MRREWPQPTLIDQRVRYNLIRNRLPVAPARVCEVGVGGGWLIKELTSRGYDANGCDQNLASLCDGVPRDKIVEANGARLPFSDNDFDATYSCDVLEHVTPHERAPFIAEMIRITKPGGLVILTAFFRCNLSFRMWGAAQLVVRHELPEWYLEHVCIKSPDEEETLSAFKSSLVEVHTERYQRSLGMLVFWLQCGESPFGRRFASFLGKFNRLVAAMDVIGPSTSTLFVGKKPLGPG